MSIALRNTARTTTRALKVQHSASSHSSTTLFPSAWCTPSGGWRLEREREREDTLWVQAWGWPRWVQP
jgi:hypothetical protein